MNMKILSISTDRKIFEAGSEVQKRMSEYGKLFDELHIVVFADKDLGHKNVKLTENIFIYPTNHKYKFLYLWRVYKIVKSILTTNYELRATDWTITVQDPFETGLVGWLLKLRYQLPLQIQIHTDIFSPYFWGESLKNKFRVLLAKFLLPHADGIRVVSERIKNSLVASHFSLSTKITVLPIFVGAKKIQSAKIKVDLHQKYPAYDFIILMASRLTREKNISMAIEAMAEVIKKYPKALLLIVGEGSEKEQLQLKTKTYNLKPNIAFEPWTKDLISYYKTSDLFLLTSNYEGYGRTVIEAMAAGVPVIMTDVGLAGELLIDDLDGLVVPVRDKNVLIEAIIRLKEDKEKRENFIKESKKVIDSLPEKSEYLTSYKELLELLL